MTKIKAHSQNVTRNPGSRQQPQGHLDCESLRGWCDRRTALLQNHRTSKFKKISEFMKSDL